MRGDDGLLHFAGSLYEYATSNPNHDLYVFDDAGTLVRTQLDWSGIGGEPVVTDGLGHHHYLAPDSTGEAGVVDAAGNVHVFSTTVRSSLWEITHRKLDATGATVIGDRVITSGAEPWNWYVRPVVTGAGELRCTWVHDTEEIQETVSSDGGVTWGPTPPCSTAPPPSRRACCRVWWGATTPCT